MIYSLFHVLSNADENTAYGSYPLQNNRICEKFHNMVTPNSVDYHQSHQKLNFSTKLVQLGLLKYEENYPEWFDKLKNGNVEPPLPFVNCFHKIT